LITSNIKKFYHDSKFEPFIMQQ